MHCCRFCCVLFIRESFRCKYSNLQNFLRFILLYSPWEKAKYSLFSKNVVFIDCISSSTIPSSKNTKRLLANRYQFTISERSIQNLEAAMADSDNLTQFMQATAYVRFKPDTEERSTYLYRAYTKWCEDNLESPVPQKKFSQFLLKNAGKYGLTFSKHIEGKFAFASAAQQ